MSLARTYWGMPSSSFEIGGNTTLPRSAYGLRGSGGGIDPILSGLRWYSPIRPRQTHGITPFCFDFKIQNTACSDLDLLPQVCSLFKMLDGIGHL